jgi:hypothetical protein
MDARRRVVVDVDSHVVFDARARVPPRGSRNEMTSGTHETNIEVADV